MNDVLNGEKKVETYAIKCCPKCGNEMDGIVKTRIDRLLSLISLKIFYVKRYLCYGCLWECRKLSVK